MGMSKVLLTQNFERPFYKTELCDIFKIIKTINLYLKILAITA